MTRFSMIAPIMEHDAREQEERRALSPAEIWPEAERTPARREKRVRAALADFWQFDRTYFPPELHSGGYAGPCSMHRDLLRISATPGMQAVMGPRDHAKTAYAVKMTVWRLLRADILLAGTYSHTLPTSERLLSTIRDVIAENPRITEDFGVDWEVDNTQEIRFRTRNDRGLRLVAAFSEGKSVRGFSYQFGRPSFILADDVETLASPLGAKHVQERIDAIGEARSSMRPDGTLLWLGNAFDTRCALWKLWKDQEAGFLTEHWHVHRYQAWTSTGPLWKARFPAETEEQLRALLKPRSERDWRGNYQSDPIEEDGQIFSRAHYREYKEIPADARGVAWCDPNLSLKSAGDTTAIGVLLYSPETDRYYARALKCRSYSDSNALLDDYFGLKESNVYAMGMDGNVGQEAQWTNHLRNWHKARKRPFPRIEFRRYHVDLIMKTTRSVWDEDRLAWPEGFKDSEEGESFMAQVFAFAGKKAGNRDDAPDWLISAFELLHERGLATRKSSEPVSPVITIPDQTAF